MESKFGFTKMTPAEFAGWIKQQNVARTVLYVQEHHTYVPNYMHFKGNNHFEMQQGMKNFHVYTNGWSDIGQHFSIFPDGMIVTGRSLESRPACIYGFNSDAICIENIGNFDAGGDVMRAEQKDAIIKVTAALCARFGIPANTDRVVYHHWFDLNTGERTNGSGVTKSCPGTTFFGGNTVESAELFFIPLLKSALPPMAEPPQVMFYGAVTSATLNVRDAPSGKIIGQTNFGAILRIYQRQGSWYRISAKKQEWVFVNFVKQVDRAVVNTAILNVRSGPGTNFNVINNLIKNEIVFIFEEKSGWAKIGSDERWVAKSMLRVES